MATVASIYLDGTYASRNATFGDDNAAWKIDNALKAVRLWNLPHRTIAEVGCGAGAILSGVAEALDAERAVGFEPMPEAYEAAKARTTGKLTFRNEPIGPENSERFDLVLCFDVFEHVEDCFSFLRNLRGMTGNFLFHIPLDLSVQMVARMKPIMGVRESVGHIHYFSKDTALALLRDCGYRIGGHFYTFGGDGCYGGRIYRMLKWPRKIAFALHQDLAVRFLGGWSLMVHAVVE